MSALLTVATVAIGIAVFCFLFIEAVTVIETWANPPRALGPVKPTLVDVLEMRLAYYRELFGRVY